MPSLFEILSTLSDVETKEKNLPAQPLVVRQVASSVIDTISYDENTETLIVDFNNGTQYEYYGVRQEIAYAFMNAGSPGTFLNKILKSGFYPYSETK